MADKNRASRSNTPATTPAVEPDLAMPPEFADDPDIPVPHAASTGALTEDAFEAMGFNTDRDELERAKLNPPTGDWKKEDSWEYTRQVMSDDTAEGDIDPKGRTFLVFAGRPLPREANGLSYEPTLRLRISPDMRYKQDKPTDIDLAYQLFLKCVDLYIEKFEEKPSQMAKFRNMLQHDSYYVRTMNGNSGPMIVEVKAKTFQRKG
jgi:hypothetical protein